MSERFISDTGRALRTPRLATLIARRAGLLLQRDRLNSQIRACEEAIRRQVRLNETAVARKNDDWFIIQVISNPEDHVDNKLAQSLLRPSLLQQITKTQSRVTISVKQVSEDKARGVASTLPRSQVHTSK